MRLPLHYLFLSIYTPATLGGVLSLPSIFQKSDQTEAQPTNSIDGPCQGVFALNSKYNDNECLSLCQSTKEADKIIFQTNCNFKLTERKEGHHRKLIIHQTRQNIPRPTFPTISSIPCNRFVARSTSYTNHRCFRACEAIKKRDKNPFRNSLFADRCVYQHWTQDKDGKVQSSDLCFSDVVYGYGDNTAFMKIGYASRYVETPAECMALCQNDRRCVSWLFEVDRTVLDHFGSRSLCHFKDQSMVEQAINTKMVDAESVVDGNVCEVRMPSQCASGERDCLQCCDNHSFTCAYHSPKHISGWKFCVPMNQCHPEFCHLKPQPTTTTSTPKPNTCKCRKKCCCDNNSGEIRWLPKPDVIENRRSQDNKSM